MYQPITFVLLFALYGFAAFIYFSQMKDHQYEYGLTKSGHPCRIVNKWDDGNIDTQEQFVKTKEFLVRNAPNGREPKPDEVQYDCFMDIDTEEYSLSNYTKTEQLAGFSEIFTFKNRNESAECEIYQYRRQCSYKDSRNKLYCSIGGNCIRKLTISQILQHVLSLALIFIIGLLILAYLLHKIDSMFSDSRTENIQP